MVLWPVIAIILLSSAPNSAVDVAKPDLRLWPEYLFESSPDKAVYFFIVKATLLSDMSKIFPDLISDFSSQFFNSTIVADYIINNTFEYNYKKNTYLWENI